MTYLSPSRFFGNSSALLLAFFTLSLFAQAPPVEPQHSIEVVDSDGYAGWDNALILDDNGYPVVAYSYKPTITGDPTSLKILRCGDADCAGTNSIRTLDQGQILSGLSLALDGNSFPVIAYLLKQTTGNNELKILHCNDANCDGGDESIVTIGVAELFKTSLALGSDGNPIVSYTSDLNLDVKNRLILLHCDDPSCAPDSGGNPENGEIVDFGSLAAMQLDTDGFPVILYNAAGTAGTKIVHCNDADCAGGDESILIFESPYANSYPKVLSMVLDAAGNPAVLYQKGSNIFMRRCNDANCAGNDETTFQVHNDSLSNAQLQLDSDGIPVVATSEDTELKIMRCDTPNCDVYLDTSRWQTDTYGNISGSTSMALDANDFPVVSYISQFSPRGELRILHCADKPCTAYWRVVGVDFQPDDPTNVVNTNGPDGFFDPEFQFEFAVMGEADLDVTQIDPSVLRLYTFAWSQNARPVDPDGVINDVNDDGFPDRIFTFNYRDISLPTCSFSYGRRGMDMRGNLYSGEQIWGSDYLSQNEAPCNIGFAINSDGYGTVHPHHNGLCWLTGCSNQNDLIQVQLWNTEGVNAGDLKLGALEASPVRAPYWLPDDDMDGYPDGLAVDFLTGDTGINCTDTEVLIQGENSQAELRVGAAPVYPDCEADAHCHP